MSSGITSKSRETFVAHLKSRGWIGSLYDTNKWINLNVPNCYWYVENGAATLKSADPEVGELMAVEFTGEQA